MLKLWVSLGVGLCPGASGTYGSILTAALAAVFVYLTQLRLGGPWYGVFLLLFSLAAWRGIDLALKKGLWGLDQDPGGIVIDEAAGVLLALSGCGPGDWLRMTAALIAFRFFDILKPCPIGSLQNLPGAWGVLVDDLAAGAFAWLAAYGLMFWLN